MKIWKKEVFFGPLGLVPPHLNDAFAILRLRTTRHRGKYCYDESVKPVNEHNTIYWMKMQRISQFILFYIFNYITFHYDLCEIRSADYLITQNPSLSCLGHCAFRQMSVSMRWLVAIQCKQLHVLRIVSVECALCIAAW